MGLMDKFKNLFTDEEIIEDEEIEEPVKIKQIKKEEPKKEENKLPTFMREKIEKEEQEKVVEPMIPKKDIVSDFIANKETEIIESNQNIMDIQKKEIHNIELPKETNTFKFPLDFEESDFGEISRVNRQAMRSKPTPEITREKKEPPKTTQQKKETKVREIYKDKKKDLEAEKKFRATPIISPIYGVLDKNYKKDDITAKKEKVSNRYYKKEENLTVDDIRKKAYGTLEDELEDTLYSSEPFVFEQSKEVETEIDIFKELEDVDMKRATRSNDLLTNDIIVENEENVDLTKELEKQKQKIEEINEFIKQNTVAKEVVVEQPVIEEVESVPVKEEISETIEEVVEEVKEEQLDNGDLFNLIDSMYEKREEE